MNYFENGEVFQDAIDNGLLEDYCDINFHGLFLDCACDNDMDIHDIPYWIGKYYKKEDIYCQYIIGTYNRYREGDIFTENGRTYECIGTAILDNEIEHQAENGDLVYEYRGDSFLRIIKEIKE